MTDQTDYSDAGNASEAGGAAPVGAELGHADRRARFAFGKALREQTPFSALAEIPERDAGAALAILDEQDLARIPQLRAERRRRMALSPFAFLRGAAAVMAQDLAARPGPGIGVQAGGDAHIMNFGAVATPEDNVFFDMNDFDETLGGVDFTVDLRRLAASVAVAAVDSGAGRKKAKAVTLATIDEYRRRIRLLRTLAPLEIWHASIDMDRELRALDNDKLAARLERLVCAARADLESDDNFPHLSAARGEDLAIADRPPDIFHFGAPGAPDLKFDVSRFFSQYRESLPLANALALSRYTLRDQAFKAVGVGSVGTFCAIGLYATGDREPLFLQIKEAQTSVLERLAPQSAWPGPQGARVVEGQKILQAASDIFLGHFEDPEQGRHFYVRRLKNRHLGAIAQVLEADALEPYALLCARTLARAHARSGDPAVIAGYMGKNGEFDDAIAEFALGYVKRTRDDYDALSQSLKPTKEAPPAAAD